MIKQGLKQGYQGFPNSGKGWGSKSPPVGGGIKNFARGDFFTEWWEPEKLFWKFKYFQSWKHHPVNAEHQLKSKLAWPVCQKSTKLKQKWYRSNDYS